MNNKKEILKKIIDMKCDSDEFEDVILDVDTINNFLELLPEQTIEQINIDLEMYV